MVSGQTYEKAFKLVRFGNIKLIKEESTWVRMLFIVTDLSGVKSNVWRIEKHGELEWHCDSKSKEGFGCIMTNPFQKEPSCCHTIATEIYLRKKANKQQVI